MLHFSKKLLTLHENDDVISFLITSYQFRPSKTINFVLGYYWRKFQLNCINNLEMPEEMPLYAPQDLGALKSPGLIWLKKFINCF